MAKILLVDDSGVDRLLARRILEEGGHEIDVATGGPEALGLLQAGEPDLVVTDLMMPDLDGLQLIDEAHELHPSLPVIIFTSKGSEEIAVRALESGAASYIPKRVMEHAMLDTVEAVLSAAAHRRRRSALLQVLVESRWSFVLGNDRELFRPLVQYVQDALAGFGLFTDAERTRIGLALDEALNNAVEHGNLELDSSQRDVDMGAYVQEMRERCDRPEFRDRRVHFEVRLSPEGAEFQIRDDGRGFDIAALGNPVADLDATSGRGIMLMRMFMDEVSFNDAGNQITLTKRCPPPS